MDEPKETPVYKHSMPVQIRFNDVDQYGHVNNNAYFAYYDLGKQNYRTSEVVPVIANINADFIIPIFHGDDIVVETRVSHLGHKSFTLQQRAINRATGLEVCRCATVMVCFNQRTKQSADIPAEFRQAIEAFEGIASQS